MNYECQFNFISNKTIVYHMKLAIESKKIASLINIFNKRIKFDYKSIFFLL